MILEVSRSEIVETLEEAKADLNYTGEDIEINFYIDKDGNILEGNVLFGEVERISYVVESGLESITISLDEGDKVTYKETSDNNANLKFISGSTEILDLKIYSSDSDFKADYKINVDGVKLSGKIEFTNIKESKSGVSFDYNFNIDTTVVGEKIDLGVSGNVKLELKDIDVFDTTDSVNINNLTDAEQKTITDNFIKAIDNLGLQDLIDEMDNL